jgi:hypothetical protein
VTDIKQISALEKYLTLAGKFVALILAVYGGYKFIYGLGHSDAMEQNNNAELVKTVDELKISVNKVNTNIVDYGQIQQEMTIKVDNYTAGQDKLINSVKSLALIVAKTPVEFARIMDGKSFEFVQSDVMKSVPSGLKIHITKKDSVK